MKNDKLSYIITSYGRIVYEKERFRREYNIIDHLGNVRVVFDQDGRLLQENHYYAHGLLSPLSKGDRGINDYLYNGKELQEEFNLNLYNYGWRQMYPQLGRWHNVDKFADYYHSTSPYAYVRNNPINLIDRFGLWDDYGDYYDDYDYDYDDYGDNGWPRSPFKDYLEVNDGGWEWEDINDSDYFDDDDDWCYDGDIDDIDYLDDVTDDERDDNGWDDDNDDKWSNAQHNGGNDDPPAAIDWSNSSDSQKAVQILYHIKYANENGDGTINIDKAFNNFSPNATFSNQGVFLNTSINFMGTSVPIVIDLFVTADLNGNYNPIVDMSGGQQNDFDTAGGQWTSQSDGPRDFLIAVPSDFFDEIYDWLNF